jgi:hypothetical protein
MSVQGGVEAREARRWTLLMEPFDKQPNDCALRRLSDQAERAAAQAPDTLADLSLSIKQALQNEADPYVLLGVLVEGVAQTLITRIPPERYDSTLVALLVKLRERLGERGAAPGKMDRCDQQPSCN